MEQCGVFPRMDHVLLHVVPMFLYCKGVLR
jgi:hypothetical protein